MPNTEYSKLKLLYLYHYFRRYVKTEAPGDGTTMADMMAYLNEMTGAEFERKSIYSDIDRINEFARSVGICDETSPWIELDGKTYKRGEVKGDLTYDEARLIVDAINATDFIDSGLCEKIKEMYPTYFKTGYNSIVPHDDRQVQKKSMYLLNTIRSAIEDDLVLTFEYGYLVASGIRGTSEKHVSPIGLDFKKSHYYLIAVDNAAVEAGQTKNDAIKTYRLDRMRRVNFNPAEKYIGFKGDREDVLKRYVKTSIDAYSFKGKDDRFVTITLSSDNEKELLKAYTGFSEDMKTTIISDKISNGSVKFAVEAGLVPPFFDKLFKVCMYEGVNMTIDDEEVKNRYEQYLKKALEVCYNS